MGLATANKSRPGTGIIGGSGTPPDQPTLVVGSELAGSSKADNARSVWKTVRVNLTLASGNTATFAHLWLSLDNGTSWLYQGMYPASAASPVVDLVTLSPEASASWRVKASMGNLNGSHDASDAVVSALFAMTPTALPSAVVISTLTVSTPGAGSFPYHMVRLDGTQYWAFTVSYDDSTAYSSNPDSFFIRLTFQDLDSSHNPVGPEHVGPGTQVTGGVQTFPAITGEYGTNGIDFVRSGNIAYVRVKVYSCNRLDQTANSFLNSAARTLQTGVGGGAGYVDILVAAGGAIPAGKLLASRLDRASLGPQLMIRNGKLDGPTPYLPDGMIGGGFEDLDPAAVFIGWSTTGSVFPDATPFGISPPTGKYACTFGPYASTSPSLYSIGYACKPGQQYVLKMTLRSDPAATSFLNVNAIWTDGVGGGTTYTTLVQPAVAAYTAFADIPPVPFIVPAGKSIFYLSVSVWDWTYNDDLLRAGYWALDNIRVTPVVSAATGTLAATDLSNLLANPRFEEGQAGWYPFGGTFTVADAIGGESAAKVALVAGGPPGYNLIYQEVKAEPGKQYFLSSFYRVTALGGSWNISVHWHDRAGAFISQDVHTGTTTGGWQQKMTCTTVAAPVGAVSMSVFFGVQGLAAGETISIDSPRAIEQISSGDGTTSDGSGGLKLKLAAGNPVSVDGSGNVTLKLATGLNLDGSGNLKAKLGANGVTVDGSGNIVVKNGGSITFDGSGNVVVGAGPGLTFNGGGALVPNQGATVGVNASGQLIVPASSLGLTEVGGVYQLYAIYFGLPGITAAVPKFIVNTATTPWSTWRQDNGSWRAVLDSRDIIANSIVALASISSPAISGGTYTGGAISITSGTQTLTISVNAAGGVLGLRLSDSSSGRTVDVTKDYVNLQAVTGNGTQVTQFGHGWISASKRDGSAGVQIDGVGGTVSVYGTAGVAGLYTNGVKVA